MSLVPTISKDHIESLTVASGTDISRSLNGTCDRSFSNVLAFPYCICWTDFKIEMTRHFLNQIYVGRFCFIRFICVSAIIAIYIIRIHTEVNSCSFFSFYAVRKSIVYINSHPCLKPMQNIFKVGRQTRLLYLSLFLDNATIPIYLKQTLLRLSGYNNLFRDSLIPKDLFFKIDFNITYVPFFLFLVELGDEDTGI